MIFFISEWTNTKQLTAKSKLKLINLIKNVHGEVYKEKTPENKLTWSNAG